MTDTAVRPSRPVSASRQDSSALMMPEDANLLGVDRIEFREPIHVGELMVLKPSVNFVGRSSIS